MSVAKKLGNNLGFFFITITCFNFLSLIKLCNAYQEIYNWFNYLDSQKIRISAFVIMPNHMHLILYNLNEELNIHSIVGNGKRFITYSVVKKLKETEKTELLLVLRKATHTADKKNGAKHRFFMKSFECQECVTEKYLWQKINYIHNNPISGKWNLSKNYFDYLHSSAGFYVFGKIHPKMNIIDFREIGD